MGEKCTLFRFYHVVDNQKVLCGILWFFNKHLILFHLVGKGEKHLQVPINNTQFWVQVHNLPGGFMLEGMARQLGNLIGQFVEYDKRTITKGYRNFMRVRMQLDVRRLLKRKKRIAIGPNETVYAMFRYETFLFFCFLCGKLGCGEGFCPIRLTLKS